MRQLSFDEFQVEMRRYYAGDPKAKPEQHLYRTIRHEDLNRVLSPDNWAVVRYASYPVPRLKEARPDSRPTHKAPARPREHVSAPV